LVLGVYSGDGAPASRLPIATRAPMLSDNRLVLGSIDVIAP
jgi:hypothetical protein